MRHVPALRLWLGKWKWTQLRLESYLFQENIARRLHVLMLHRPTDCYPTSQWIVPRAKLWKPKMCSLTPREMEELKGLIDKNLARGFIQPAKLKNVSLRRCVDYRGINAICVENMYPPLRHERQVTCPNGEFSLNWIWEKRIIEWRLGRGMSGRPCSVVPWSATNSGWCCLWYRGLQLCSCSW